MKRSALVLCLVFVLVAPIVLLIQTNSILPNTEAQTTPSVTEFTVQYTVSTSYLAPTTSTDPYTGQNKTTGYDRTVYNETVVFTIRNQPFTPYTDSNGNYIGLYYNFRYKGHYQDQWTYDPFNPDGLSAYAAGGWFSGPFPYHNQSSTDYTTITFDLHHFVGYPGSNDGPALPNGSQLDFQVQAQIGHIAPAQEGSMSLGDYYGFTGQSSDWSSTQTLIIANPPKISVISPQAENYTVSDVALNFTVDNPVSQIAYCLDGQENVTVVGDTILSGLSNGLHNVTVYVNDTYGGTGKSETVNFTVAVAEPLAPFPTTLVIASVASIVVIGAGLLVYFKKHKGSHNL
jgi:hypothetical protein